MSNKLKVTYLDGAIEQVMAGARAEVEVERKFGISFSYEFASGKARNEFLFFLAWSAMQLNGATAEEFDNWLLRVDDVDVESGGPERPTKRARRPANSSN